MSTGTFKIKTYKKDWAEKIADAIADQSAMTPDEYRKFLKEQLADEADHWGEWDKVNIWCGTAVIVRELRKAYQRGRAAERRATHRAKEHTRR